MRRNGQDEEIIDLETPSEWKDDIDDKFGDYDSEIRQEIRSLEAPLHEQVESSLDPGDLDEFLENGFPFKRADWEALQKAAEAEIKELEELRDPVPESYRDQIAHRVKLVEGKDPEEVKWLKMKAYYKARDLARASAAQRAQLDQTAKIYDAGAPMDFVTVDQLRMTPQDFAQARLKQRTLQDEEAHRLVTSKDLGAYYGEEPSRVPAHLLIDNYSQDSEWASDWANPQYVSHPHVLQNFFADYGLLFVSGKGAPHKARQAPALSGVEEVEEIELEVPEEDIPDKAQSELQLLKVPVRIYTKQYKDYLGQKKILVEQKQQQKQVFVTGITTVVAASFVRWLWRSVRHARRQ